jgi:hypothetical protein
VSFDPGDNLPNAVVITDFDQNGHQLQTSGDIPPLNATALFTTGIQPETKYYFQVCTITVDQGGGNYPDYSAWNQFSATTFPSQTPPSPPNPTIKITGIKAFPRMAYKNGST